MKRFNMRTIKYTLIALTLGIAAFIGLVIFALSLGVNAQPTESFAQIVQKSIPTLMYHHIGEVPASQKNNAVRKDLTISTTKFEEQLSWLKENNFTTKPLVTVAAGKPFVGTKKIIVLTFDDGYDDAYTVAFPLLKKYGFSGSFAIITNFVGKPEYMTWEQIQEMHASGMEILAHTVSHKDLANLTAEAVKYEIGESKKILTEKLGTPITGFVYPSGHFNKAAIQALKDAGYTAARTTQEGVLARRSLGEGVVSRGDDPFKVGTQRIRGSLSAKDFAKIITKLAQ